MQMTVATTDGESVWAFRYSSERQSRSLFVSTDVATLRQLHPEVEMLHGWGRRPGSSSPNRSAICPGAWNEVPESSAGVVRPGQTRSAPSSPSLRELLGIPYPVESPPNVAFDRHG